MKHHSQTKKDHFKSENYNLTNKHEIFYDTFLPSGKILRHKIIFGRNNSNITFDPQLLEEAFNEITGQYGQEVAAMNKKTLKVLTWEKYQKQDPFKYRGIKENQMEDEPPLMKESITLVNPHIENGSSALLLGGSNSGKTTLLVQALTNLLNDYRKRYDMIIIFSQTLTSLPLRDLPKDDKLIIFSKFLPSLVTFLIRVQMETSKPKDPDNPTEGNETRYSILLVLDDITKLKDPMIDELILVSRNYGISTIVCTQKVTGLSPSARASIHTNYILGGRNPETRRKIIETYLRGYIVERGIKNADDMDKWLRENTEMGTGERKLIKLNGINDIMSLHTIKK